MRETLREVVEASKLWDRKVGMLRLTDTPGDMLDLRILVRARGGATCDLHREVREAMIAFLQAEYPRASPRQRTEVTAGEGGWKRCSLGAASEWQWTPMPWHRASLAAAESKRMWATGTWPHLPHPGPFRPPVGVRHRTAPRGA